MNDKIIKNDINNKIIRKYRNKLFFFNKNGIYTSIPEEDAQYLFLDNYPIKGFPVDLRNVFQSYNVDICKMRSAISHLEEGQTVEELEFLYTNTHFVQHTSLDEINRFMQRIESPLFLRNPENFNKKTFDMIKVRVCIAKYWSDNRIDYIRQNWDIICENVIDKISNSKKFQKYNVPINFLQLTECIFCSDSTLQFVFELKITS